MLCEGPNTRPAKSCNRFPSHGRSVESYSELAMTVHGCTIRGRSATNVERVFVLGIDPGMSRCGYGLLQRGRDAAHAVSAGVLTTPR